MLPGDEPEHLSPIDPRSLIRHARQRLALADADETVGAVAEAAFGDAFPQRLAALPDAP